MCIDCKRSKSKKKRSRRRQTKATCTIWEIYAPDEHLSTYAWRWTIKFGVVEIAHTDRFTYREDARSSAKKWAERHIPHLSLEFKDRSRSNFDHLI